MRVFCVSLGCDGYYSNDSPKCPSPFHRFDAFCLHTWLAPILCFLLCFGATWSGFCSDKMRFAGQCHQWMPWVSPGNTMGGHLEGTAAMAVSLLTNNPLSSLCQQLLPHHPPDSTSCRLSAFFPRAELTSDWCGLVSATAFFGLLPALEGHQIAAVVLRPP